LHSAAQDLTPNGGFPAIPANPWVYVPTSRSSYAGTSCRLRAYDQSFNESTISTTAVRAPITPGASFKLTGVFPLNAVDTQIYALAVDCKLPTNWVNGDPNKDWFVDDISIDLN